MSSELMRQTADVLEKLAEVLDADENQRQTTHQQERRTLAQKLGEKFAAVTGEDLAPEAIEKLASSDHDLVSIFHKLAERAPHPEMPDSMGTVADPSDDDTAHRGRGGQVKQAAAEDADRRFLDWVNS